MLSLQQDRVARSREGACSDCGHVTSRRTPFFDQHTCSSVELCMNCLPAFLQRQNLPPGCCGEL